MKSEAYYTRELDAIYSRINQVFKDETYRTLTTWRKRWGNTECLADLNWREFWTWWERSIRYSGTVDRASMRRKCEERLKPLLAEYERADVNRSLARHYRQDPEEFEAMGLTQSTMTTNVNYER